MPRKKGEAISKKRTGVTDFGAFFYELCDYTEMTPAEIATLAGLSEAVISRNTRVTEGTRTYPPTRETVTLLFDAFEQVAREKGLLLIPEVRQSFFNADPALLATVEQAERAGRMIGQLHSMVEQSLHHNSLAEDPPKSTS